MERLLTVPRKLDAWMANCAACNRRGGGRNRARPAQKRHGPV